MENIKEKVSELIQQYIEFDIIQTINSIKKEKEKLIYNIKLKLCLDKNNKEIHNTIEDVINEFEKYLE